jgi:hypothetical protein
MIRASESPAGHVNITELRQHVRTRRLGANQQRAKVASDFCAVGLTRRVVAKVVIYLKIARSENPDSPIRLAPRAKRKKAKATVLKQAKA